MSSPARFAFPFVHMHEGAPRAEENLPATV
jgi:hypothetical protein